MYILQIRGVLNKAEMKISTGQKETNWIRDAAHANAIAFCQLAGAQRLCVKRCNKLFPWSGSYPPEVSLPMVSNQYSSSTCGGRDPKVYSAEQTIENWLECGLRHSVHCVYHHLRCEVGGCVGWVEVSRARRKCRPRLHPFVGCTWSRAAGCWNWTLAHSHVTCRWRGSRRDRRKWVTSRFFLFIWVLVFITRQDSWEKCFLC